MSSELPAMIGCDDFPLIEQSEAFCSCPECQKYFLALAQRLMVYAASLEKVEKFN